MVNIKLLSKTIGCFLLCASFLLTACGTDANPKDCGAISEAKGHAIAKKAVMQFLRYAGKTHAPISGDSGTLDAAKLERATDGDLIFDHRVPPGTNTYQFHLSWAPNAIFTGAVAPNCSVTTNWSIQ